MLDENAYYEITVKEPHKGETASFKVWWEADICDWGVVMKNILNWVSFHPDNIKELFGEEVEEPVLKKEKRKKD